MWTVIIEMLPVHNLDPASLTIYNLKTLKYKGSRSVEQLKLVEGLNKYCSSGQNSKICSERRKKNPVLLMDAGTGLRNARTMHQNLLLS